MNRLLCLALVFAVLAIAADPRSINARQPDKSGSGPSPEMTPLAKLRELAARLDKPLKQIRYSAVKVEVRKTDAAAPVLVGTISAKKTILYTDDDPMGRFTDDDVAYIEELVILAEYLEGKWIYAGCKGRIRKPTEVEWQSYEGTRKQIRMHCMDELDAMQMDHDSDAE